MKVTAQSGPMRRPFSSSTSTNGSRHCKNASLHEVRSRQDRLLTGYMKQVEEYDSLIIEQANTITQRMNDEHAEYRASIEREFAKERANLLGQIEGQQNLFESMVMEVINS